MTMAESIIKRGILFETTSTTSTTSSVAANGTAWFTHTRPTGYDIAIPIGYYITGMDGYAYAFRTDNIAVRNTGTSAATPTITIYWLGIKLGGVIRRLSHALQSLSFKTERGCA